MRPFFLIILLLGGLWQGLSAQSTALWEDGRVASIYISLPPDSLVAIYDNPLGTRDYAAEFVYDDGTFRDTVPQTGFRLRGNTTRFAEKKSFKISFNEFVPGRRYQGVKQLNLNGQHNDPTLIREKLFYEVWARCGMPERRTSFVKVYINGAYYGLYTCLEELDKDWLQQVFQENDGNLFKCTYPADLVYLGPNQATYKAIQSSTVTGGRAYELQTNEAADDYSGFVALVAALDQPADAAFAATIDNHIHVEGMLKALAIDVATGNWDNYSYNKNNYFLYQPDGSSRFEFITYDTDNTFGIDWVQRDWATRDCRDWLSHSEARPLASQLLAVPVFRNRYYTLLDSITRHVTRPDVIFPRIDSLKALITPAVTHDYYRTLDYGYTMADFELGFVGTVDGHTPYGVKPFLGTRYAYTLSQLSTVERPEPSDALAGLSLYPNPAGAAQVVALYAADPARVTRMVRVLDAYGRVCLDVQWPAGAHTCELPLQGLARGMYGVRVEEAGRHTVLKLAR